MNGWRRPKQEIDRFFSKMVPEDRGYETACLIWHGFYHRGRPKFHLQSPDRRHVYAERYVYALHHGEKYIYLTSRGITNYIVHLCGQTDCVRLEHLKLEPVGDEYGHIQHVVEGVPRRQGLAPHHVHLRPRARADR